MSDRFGVAPLIPVLATVPPSPGAGYVRVYARAGAVYGIDEAGTEMLLTNMGSGNAPAGSCVLSDSLGPLRVIYAESNAGQTDAVNFTLRPRYADSNAGQTDAVSIRLQFPDSNAGQSEAGTTMTVVYTATGSWTAPTGVTSVIVECLGGGQGGAAGSATTGGKGGDGGGYARSTLTVAPGTAYTVTVGAAAAVGGVGQSSWFNTATTIRGKGGGSADTNIGTTIFTGGVGAAGATLGTGGGGGGGAGASTGGVNAVNGTAGGAGSSLGKTYYIKPGAGGNGATGAGVAGVAPGGGGGAGGGSVTSPGAGTVGTRGEVRITWTLA